MRTPGRQLARSSVYRTRHTAVPWLAALALIVAACASSEPEPRNSPSATPSAPPAALECEVQGYPCSLADVPVEILERSDALGEEVLAMLGRGTSSADAAAWLDEQQGMAEVESSELAIRFRLQGGRETWILRRGALGTKSVSGLASAGTPSVRPLRSVLDYVVGESKEKTALVLSPFLWDFGDSDEGPVVAGILNGTRGYEGGVTYRANSSATASDVGVSSFKGWLGYDVIHLSSHGTRICDDVRCRAMVLVSPLGAALPEGPGSKADKVRSLTDTGLGVAKAETTSREGEHDFLLLAADFFRSEYPSGLDDAVIFFSACESFGSQATDLADALRGSTSVFLGWDESVDTDDAFAAAVALYQELSERGYPVEVAYENLGALRTDRDGARLVLGERPTGGDLRIRDVVYLLHPETGQILSAADDVGIVGTQRDGQPDAVPYRVRVDGVTSEFAPETMLYVSVDGVVIDPQPLSAGERNEADQWELTGVVPLPYDVGEQTEVVFLAWVELHSGGQSDHETAATLTGPGPIACDRPPGTVPGAGPVMGLVWVLVAEYSHLSRFEGTVPSTASTHLVLCFEEGQDVNESNPTYVVTAGTVTYDHSQTDRFCEVKADPITFDVTGDDATNSHLTFDTTVTPGEYTAFIDTSGPEFVASYACRAGTGPDAPEGYQEPVEQTEKADILWLAVFSDEHRTISADGTTISGSYENLGTQVSYTFTRTE